MSTSIFSARTLGPRENICSSRYLFIAKYRLINDSIGLPTFNKQVSNEAAPVARPVHFIVYLIWKVFTGPRSRWLGNAVVLILLRRTVYVFTVNSILTSWCVEYANSETPKGISSCIYSLFASFIVESWKWSDRRKREKLSKNLWIRIPIIPRFFVEDSPRISISSFTREITIRFQLSMTIIRRRRRDTRCTRCSDNILAIYC